LEGSLKQLSVQHAFPGVDLVDLVVQLRKAIIQGAISQSDGDERFEGCTEWSARYRPGLSGAPAEGRSGRIDGVFNDRGQA
jgi:hypothetical protein